MTEKKTFKNPAFVSGFSYPGISNSRWEVHYMNAEGADGSFPRDEWDLEVTFTKKAPQFPVGAKVKSKYSNTYTYTVLAQWKDSVIVVDESDDEIEFFDTDDLVIL